ncbi:RagB/SusD family nutrient uptake outer membrane protein [Polaribacter sp. Hel1_85]|uniref:RagB/SusD family nutrient uptake outer membrane protein n=1 Tax=Polaribacter sp. Hel1_85 TaxID=1250005 RepID=UPI00052D909B|nr:RagB/SusD family nutrient uptake outer membrane protein [Polaribacter sp. Hel1_85]KGL58903.1 SusD/RagB family lipoprotein [Polaribacter sp. Hel1_85]
MKLTNKIITIITLALGATGCSDFLDDDVQYTREEVITESRARSRGFIENIYPDYDYEFNKDFGVEVLTDNAVQNITETPAAATGYWSPTYNPYGYVWQQSYDNIRQVYQYITLVHDTGLPFQLTDADGEDNPTNINTLRRYYGEAYFLKAFAEWELLKYFGGPSENDEMLGFPIVNEILENEDYITLKRNTYQECFDQIMKDLDTAIEYLPLEYSGTGISDGTTAIETGRASGMAAYALKAKVALFAASPAFNPTNDIEKWELAATYAEDVITQNGGLRSLQAFNFSNDSNSDHFWRLRNTYQSNDLEKSYYPPTLYGAGIINPSQNLVDAFPDSQGYPITDGTSSYDPSTPYAGRDQRFYKFIFYNNDECFDTESCTDFNPLEIYRGGLDNYGGFKNSVGTRTGYYLKKYMNNLDFDPSSLSATTTQPRVYVQLGLTEVYLGYAEALNEIHNDPTTAPAGHNFSAKEVLQKIRIRAGYTSSDPHLDNSSSNQSDFEVLLRNERRIELCFTSDRFHDLRRWKEIVNIEDIKGVKVTKNEDDTFSYEDIIVEERNYEEKNYYLPLPYGEVIKSTILEQNKGW